jgi:hypothetical protein
VSVIAAKVYDRPFKPANDDRGTPIEKGDRVLIVSHDSKSGTRAGDVGLAGTVEGFNRSGRVIVSGLPNPVRPDALRMIPTQAVGDAWQSRVAADRIGKSWLTPMLPPFDPTKARKIKPSLRRRNRKAA